MLLSRADVYAHRRAFLMLVVADDARYAYAALIRCCCQHDAHLQISPSCSFLVTANGSHRSSIAIAITPANTAFFSLEEYPLSPFHCTVPPSPNVSPTLSFCQRHAAIFSADIFMPTPMLTLMSPPRRH